MFNILLRKCVSARHRLQMFWHGSLRRKTQRFDSLYSLISCDCGWVRAFIEGYDDVVNLQAYHKLVKDLDDESIETVGRILSRISFVRDLLAKSRHLAKVEMFTDEECGQIRLRRQMIRPIGIEKNVYMWHGFLLPIPHFEMGVFLDRLNTDTLVCRDRLLSRDIVDAGAYVGDSALILCRLTHRKVYAFEPCENAYNKMRHTLKLNHITNVIPVKAGLGAHKGETNIVSMGAGSSVVLNNRGRAVERIQVVALDEFVEENKLDVGLIKVDIEGAEQEFLKGAANTIRSMLPSLIFSIYHSPRDFFEIKPLLEELSGEQYRFRVWKPLDGHILADTCLLAEPIA